MQRPDRYWKPDNEVPLGPTLPKSTRWFWDTACQSLKQRPGWAKCCIASPPQNRTMQRLQAASSSGVGGGGLLAPFPKLETLPHIFIVGKRPSPPLNLTSLLRTLLRTLRLMDATAPLKVGSPLYRNAYPGRHTIPTHCIDVPACYVSDTPLLLSRGLDPSATLCCNHTFDIMVRLARHWSCK